MPEKESPPSGIFCAGVLLLQAGLLPLQAGLLLLLLLGLLPLARQAYRRLLARRLMERMRGRNHPAIPSLLNQSFMLPLTGSAAQPENAPEPDPVPEVGEFPAETLLPPEDLSAGDGPQEAPSGGEKEPPGEALDDYHFYEQLDD